MGDQEVLVNPNVAGGGEREGDEGAEVPVGVVPPADEPARQEGIGHEDNVHEGHEARRRVFTEEEVRSKIRDLRNELRAQALSVRKPRMFVPEDQSIKMYVEDFDTYRTVVSLSKDMVYKTLLSYLPDKQKLKLRALNLSEGAMADWDTVKTAVVAALTPPVEKLDARLKLETAKQEDDELVEDFYDRIRALVEKCYDKPSEINIRDRILKDTLVRGLRDDVVGIEVLANSETMSLNELSQLAMRRELAVKARNTMDRKSVVPRDSTVSILHVNEDFRDLHVSQNRENNAGPSETRQQQYGGERCYRCGSTGHYVRSCPVVDTPAVEQYTRRCWECNGPHLVRNCPHGKFRAGGMNRPGGSGSTKYNRGYNQGYGYGRQSRGVTASGRGNGNQRGRYNEQQYRYYDSRGQGRRPVNNVDRRVSFNSANVNEVPNVASTNVVRNTASRQDVRSDIGLNVTARGFSPVPRAVNSGINSVLYVDDSESDEETANIVSGMFELCLGTTGDFDSDLN